MAQSLEDRIPYTLLGSTNFLLGQISYLSDYDQERAIEAFYLSAAWHGQQRRKGGQLYIKHPVQVAAICANARQDADCLIAALLHDTLEDTAATSQELEQQFGPDVRMLVESVTRYPAISHHQFMEKVYGRGKQDVRVAVIKVADVCANMMHHDQRQFTSEKHAEHLQEAHEYYLGWLIGIPGFPVQLARMLERVVTESERDYTQRIAPHAEPA